LDRLRRSLSRDPLAVLGIVLVMLVATMVLVASWAPHDPTAVNLAIKLSPPNARYWLGTDEAGRDLFTRILYGARLSVLTGAAVLAVALAIGSSLGTIAGYYGGMLDESVMRIADFFLAFPYLILAMAIAFSLGASVRNAMIAIVVVLWPSYARLLRGQIASIRHFDFVQAARALGATDGRIMGRHIVPQVGSSLLVKVSLDMGFVIVAMASLGFIGLGAKPPVAEWGTKISQSTEYALDAWWYGLFPGLAICLAVLGFNLVGDFIQEWLEPELRTH